jgi:hypothetical protein
MYDIKIFLEEDWKFSARVKAWKEIVYWVWKNQEGLMEDIREWLEISFCGENNAHPQSLPSKEGN